MGRSKSLTVIDPLFVFKDTDTMPGSSIGTQLTGQLSRVDNQIVKSAALGLDGCAITVPLRISGEGLSSAEANVERNGVRRVQARSVSPGS